LYEIVSNAHDGEGMSTLSREFGLSPTQTEAAVNALLPAISTGLKQSTKTVDGLGKVFGVMGKQEDLPEIYDAPETAFTPEGVAAGNDALSAIFGSPDVKRGVVDQAQAFSGVGSGILSKMLPVLAGIVMSGLMRSTSTAGPGAHAPAHSGGNLGDILGQIFGRGDDGQQSPSPAPRPSPSAQASPGPQASPSPQPSPGIQPTSGPSAGTQQSPSPGTQPAPLPTDAGGGPGGDILGSMLRQLENGLRDGSIKPVIIGGGGPVQMPMPGGQQDQAPSGPGAAPQGGDIFGQILRNVLGGVLGGGGLASPQGQQAPSPQMKDMSDLSKRLGVMGGAGAAVFGDHIEPGQDVEQSHMDNIQSVFDRFFGGTEKR
jgi:hypothetical protein